MSGTMCKFKSRKNSEARLLLAMLRLVATFLVLRTTNAFSPPNPLAAIVLNEGAFNGPASHQEMEISNERGIRIKRNEGGGHIAEYLDVETEVFDNDPLFFVLDKLTEMAEGKANCETELSLEYLGLEAVDDAWPSGGQAAAEEAVDTANFLNILLQTTSNDQNYSDVYYTLVRRIVEGSDYIYGTKIAFDSYKYSSKVSGFAPYAYRETSNLVIVDNLGKDGDYTEDSEWFKQHKTKAAEKESELDVAHGYDKTKANGASNTSHTVVDLEDVYRTLPYVVCDPRFHILVTFSAPFFGPDAEFLGVVGLDLALEQTDINQCQSESPSIFLGTNKCRNTTVCSPIAGGGFRSGHYKCQCDAAYYFPLDTNLSLYEGKAVEQEYKKALLGESNVLGDLECAACAAGCDSCSDGQPCWVSRSRAYGLALYVVNVLEMVAIVALMIVVVIRRKTKVLSIDSPLLYNIVFVGALLLYASSLGLFYSPTNRICFIIKWFQEIGFSLVYGTLILKTYRVLAIFQARSATRILVRDKDLIKWLMVILFVLSVVLSTWTISSMKQFEKYGGNMVVIGTNYEGHIFETCLSTWWDIVVESAEVLFLLFGCYLCRLVRTAPALFDEHFYIFVVLVKDAAISIIFYLIRELLWLRLSPDWVFFMYTLKYAVTTGITLAVIFIPKVICHYKMKRDAEFRKRANSDGLTLENKLRPTSRFQPPLPPPPVIVAAATVPTSTSMSLTTTTTNTTSTVITTTAATTSITNTTSSPFQEQLQLQEQLAFAYEEIGLLNEELKRSYTQLEVLKTAKMRVDNPHLKSKRGVFGSKWINRKLSRRYSGNFRMRGSMDNGDPTGLRQDDEVELENIKPINDERASTSTGAPPHFASNCEFCRLYPSSAHNCVEMPPTDDSATAKSIPPNFANNISHRQLYEIQPSSSNNVTLQAAPTVVNSAAAGSPSTTSSAMCEVDSLSDHTGSNTPLVSHPSATARTRNNCQVCEIDPFLAHNSAKTPSSSGNCLVNPLSAIYPSNHLPANACTACSTPYALYSSPVHICIDNKGTTTSCTCVTSKCNCPKPNHEPPFKKDPLPLNTNTSETTTTVTNTASADPGFSTPDQSPNSFSSKNNSRKKLEKNQNSEEDLAYV